MLVLVEVVLEGFLMGSRFLPADLDLLLLLLVDGGLGLRVLLGGCEVLDDVDNSTLRVEVTESASIGGSAEGFTGSLI